MSEFNGGGGYFVFIMKAETQVVTSGLLVVGFKADCLTKGPKSMGRVPSVGVFLRDPSPFLQEFRRKPEKTPNC